MDCVEIEIRNKFCILAAIAFVVLYAGGLIVVAQIIPPYSPSLTAEEVASFYGHNNVRIKTGLAMALAGVCFLFPIVAAVSSAMAKVEKQSSFLSKAQLACGLIAVLFFMIPIFLWLTAAYRPDRTPELILLVSDLAWFILVSPVVPFALQVVAISLCGLMSQEGELFLPRWLSFMGLWVAIGGIPGVFIPFVMSGPFAWSGLFSLWLPIGIISLWIVLVVANIFFSHRKQEMREVDSYGSDHSDFNSDKLCVEP